MFNHYTVMKYELATGLNLQEGSIAIDVTAGGGGHTAVLLEKVGNTGKVIAFDKDQTAISHLTEKFKAEIATGRLILIHDHFDNLRKHISRLDLSQKIDAICADIGVSSPQIDQATRGFSFINDGPLDMRMDNSQELTAFDVVNTYDEAELARVIFEYGEEKKSRYIARKICNVREESPIKTTLELANLIESAIKYKTKSRKHPATKSFQAIRIEVNKELEQLSTLLKDGFDILKPGGFFGVISFHSLEDRIIKQDFKKLAKGTIKNKIPRNLPITESELNKINDVKAKLVKPFPIVPTDEEISENARSRSAKLRIIEKMRV